MAAAPYPSEEFGKASKEALAKAGTVAFPWPPPASGPLYIGTNPDFHPDLRSGLPQFYLRSVQTVTPGQVITRIVNLEELRGISLPPKSTKEGTSLREFRTVNGIASEIVAAKARLTGAAKAAAGAYEDRLFEDAIIYVREAAPVVLRINYEFGVCAAEAAENVEKLTVGKSGCCTDVIARPCFDR